MTELVTERCSWWTESLRLHGFQRVMECTGGTHGDLHRKTRIVRMRREYFGGIKYLAMVVS